jgi:hypothetical protein
LEGCVFRKLGFFPRPVKNLLFNEIFFEPRGWVYCYARLLVLFLEKYTFEQKQFIKSNMECLTCNERLPKLKSCNFLESKKEWFQKKVRKIDKKSGTEYAHFLI